MHRGETVTTQKGLPITILIETISPYLLEVNIEDNLIREKVILIDLSKMELISLAACNSIDMKTKLKEIMQYKTRETLTGKQVVLCIQTKGLA